VSKRYSKETRRAIEGIDDLYKAMNAKEGEEYGADYPMVMIHLVQALMATDFEKAEAYHHAMNVGYSEWKESFDKNHDMYVGPK